MPEKSRKLELVVDAEKRLVYTVIRMKLESFRKLIVYGDVATMKKNKYSRLTAALLSFLLLLSLIPASVFAADEEDDNTNPPEVKVGWQVSQNGTTIKESTDDTQVVLKNQVNIGADTVATKIPFKQNDKVVFSVNVDPQYAEYTTYEWRHYLMQWKHRLTRAHREKQLKMSCQALHNAPPNRT